MALTTDDEPGRRLLVPLLGTTHVALAPRSHWCYRPDERRIRDDSMTLEACADLRAANAGRPGLAQASEAFLLTPTLFLRTRPGA